jgi:hypothetical protein
MEKRISLSLLRDLNLPTSILKKDIHSLTNDWNFLCYFFVVIQKRWKKMSEASCQMAGAVILRSQTVSLVVPRVFFKRFS